MNVRADRLQADEIEQTVPTIGFNMETLQYKNIKFQVWDLGGQTSIRPYWRCYYPNTDAIIYVVDSADTDRLNIAKQELHAMLEVRGCATCHLFSYCVVHVEGLASFLFSHAHILVSFCDSWYLQEEELKDSILLVFANKQDQKGALNAAQVRLHCWRDAATRKWRCGEAFNVCCFGWRCHACS